MSEHVPSCSLMLLHVGGRWFRDHNGFAGIVHGKLQRLETTRIMVCSERCVRMVYSACCSTRQAVRDLDLPAVCALRALSVVHQKHFQNGKPVLPVALSRPSLWKTTLAMRSPRCWLMVDRVCSCRCWDEILVDAPSPPPPPTCSGSQLREPDAATGGRHRWTCAVFCSVRYSFLARRSVGKVQMAIVFG